jgi:AGZA family xanthine/uracil permease-like MFS transporter
MKTTTLIDGRRWHAPGNPATQRAGTRSPLLGTHDLRGGLVSLLGSVYIVVLIPMILGVDGSQSPIASISATALACAVGTALFALIARLPFAVGPGIVPASIVATFLGSGIPFNVVLGIEVIAGLLFLALVATGAIQGWVRRTPAVLKTAGQVAIGLYLLLAALRATGVLQAGHGPAAPSLAQEGLLFLIGLAVVLQLHRSKRIGGYAILIGIVVATAGAVVLGLVSLPTAAFKAPDLVLFKPDVVAAFDLQYLDETLILLYVVVVDVVATLETIANCSPEMRGADGRLRNFDRGLLTSAMVFLASPFLGTAPMLVLFESLGGVMSGARTSRAAAVCALGFFAIIFVSPLANAIPTYACAVALGYIGYSISKCALLQLPVHSGDATAAQLGRQLAGVAVICMIVTNSVALTIFALFAMYPMSALRSGQKLHPSDMVGALASLALIWMAFR